MPNPVAANDLQPISGSLQTSRVSYGVETAGKNYGQNYNGTTWYSDIPNNGQFYTIISDNYTANYYNSRSLAEGAYVEGGLPAVDEYSAPVFWVTPGTSSLDIVTIVNGLPDRIGQIPFNSGSQALNWIASSSNYFAVGPDYYAQIDADNLQLYLNANQIISYPTTMSAWYDLSGNNKNGSLINGPLFDSNGYITFDGVDDSCTFPINTFNSGSPQQGTFSILMKFPTLNTSSATIIFQDGGDGNNLIYLYRNDGFPTNQYNWLIYSTGSTGQGFYLQGTTYLPGIWYDTTFTFDNTGTGSIYRNGELINSSATVGGGNFISWKRTGNNQPGINPASAVGTGSIQAFKWYNKALSIAEVKQNYYGGPIVTNGLIYAIDAGNLVSYPKSGTTAYDLTGSNNGTLTNGTGFSSEDGGTWTFDGVDDGINIGTLTPTGGATFEAWINITSGNSNYGAIFTNWGSSANAFFIGTFPSSNYIQVYFNGSLIFEVLNLPFSTWILLTVTNNGSNVSAYVNGILTNTASGTLVSATGITSIGYDINRIDYPFKGNISNAKIYNRALTAAEVLQNYNATK
jgi:hypothetical protein